MTVLGGKQNILLAFGNGEGAPRLFLTVDQNAVNNRLLIGSDGRDPYYYLFNSDGYESETERSLDNTYLNNAFARSELIGNNPLLKASIDLMNSRGVAMDVVNALLQFDKQRNLEIQKYFEQHPNASFLEALDYVDNQLDSLIFLYQGTLNNDYLNGLSKLLRYSLAHFGDTFGNVGFDRTASSNGSPTLRFGNPGSNQLGINTNIDLSELARMYLNNRHNSYVNGLRKNGINFMDLNYNPNGNLKLDAQAYVNSDGTALPTNPVFNSISYKYGTPEVYADLSKTETLNNAYLHGVDFTNDELLTFKKTGNLPLSFVTRTNNMRDASQLIQLANSYVPNYTSPDGGQSLGLQDIVLENALSSTDNNVKRYINNSKKIDGTNFTPYYVSKQIGNSNRLANEAVLSAADVDMLSLISTFGASSVVPTKLSNGFFSKFLGKQFLKNQTLKNIAPYASNALRLGTTGLDGYFTYSLGKGIYDGLKLSKLLFDDGDYNAAKFNTALTMGINVPFLKASTRGLYRGGKELFGAAKPIASYLNGVYHHIPMKEGFNLSPTLYSNKYLLPHALKFVSDITNNAVENGINSYGAGMVNKLLTTALGSSFMENASPWIGYGLMEGAFRGLGSRK